MTKHMLVEICPGTGRTTWGEWRKGYPTNEGLCHYCHQWTPIDGGNYYLRKHERRTEIPDPRLR